MYRLGTAGSLMDGNIDIILQSSERVVAWKKYMKMIFRHKLYGTNSNNCESGFRIFKEEVEKAIILEKSGKASGPDYVFVEVFKLMHHNVINIFTNFLQIYIHRENF